MPGPFSLCMFCATVFNGPFYGSCGCIAARTSGPLLQNHPYGDDNMRYEEIKAGAREKKNKISEKVKKPNPRTPFSSLFSTAAFDGWTDTWYICTSLITARAGWLIAGSEFRMPRWKCSEVSLHAQCRQTGNALGVCLWLWLCVGRWIPGAPSWRSHSTHTHCISLQCRDGHRSSHSTTASCCCCCLLQSKLGHCRHRQWQHSCQFTVSTGGRRSPGMCAWQPMGSPPSGRPSRVNMAAAGSRRQFSLAELSWKAVFSALTWTWLYKDAAGVRTSYTGFFLSNPAAAARTAEPYLQIAKQNVMGFCSLPCVVNFQGIWFSECCGILQIIGKFQRVHQGGLILHHWVHKHQISPSLFFHAFTEQYSYHLLSSKYIWSKHLEGLLNPSISNKLQPANLCNICRNNQTNQ